MSPIHFSKNHASHLTPFLFFDEVIHSYKKAASASGGQLNQFYKIGGLSVCLSFAGAPLVPFISPALEHLRSEKEEKPDLKVYMWDSASTGIPLPLSPWASDDCIQQKKAWHFQNHRFHILYRPECHTLNILDKTSLRASFWIDDFKNLPQYEIGSPLLAVFHWWFNLNDIHLIHAAAVGKPEGGVLIGGRTGSGKSTTALSCLLSGLQYLGDDYCLISDSPSPYVCSLYSSAKLNTEDARRFPDLKPAAIDLPGLEKERKSVYFLHSLFPRKTLRSFPLKAVLIPKQKGNGSPRIKKVSSASGVMSLAPSTMFQLAGYRKQLFENLGRIVKKVPNYLLELGEDPAQNGAVISDFLSKQSP